MSCEVAPSVHSLLRFADFENLAWADDMPIWAPAALRRAAWAVVRRAPPREGYWPVGVRGDSRAERAAAWLPKIAVEECVSPQSLVAQIHSRHFVGHAVGAIAVLPAVGAIFSAQGLSDAWGPGGSVGFELASGLPTATASSDLDLIVCVDAPGALRDPARLHTELCGLPVRTDVLLETPQGGVLLSEYIGGGEMLLRSNSGRRLVRSPWGMAAT